MKTLIRLLGVCVLAGAMAAGATAGTFRWGVNGHPNVQEGYCQVPIAAQLNLVAELGTRWYRCDWDQARLDADLRAYDNLVDAAARRGVHILPVIFPATSARSDATPDEIRRASFEFARRLVSHFRGRVTHWELDNELDLYALIRKGETTRTGVVWEWGDPDGDKPEHFEETRYAKARAELLGLYEGVKAADPKALTIIDAGGWLHYGFFERLVREDQAPFDILGWHWYSEMGDMTRVRGDFDVLKQIRSYGRPVWLTEIDRRGGSLGGKEAEQAQYLAGAARQLPAQRGIEAFFVYELLDEPYFGAENPESHYGLVTLVKNADGLWRTGRRKPTFAAMRKAIRSEGAPTAGATINPTFSQLTEQVRSKIDTHLRRRSDEIDSSPFATLVSSEVHGPDRDIDVARLMRELGVKWVVMHNYHGMLGSAEDARLNRWLALCAEAKIRPYCILVSEDLELWRAAAANYGDRIGYFGFLNEPNAPTENDHTRPHVAAARYVEKLREVREAVKGVSPDVKLYAPECAMLQCMEEKPYPWLPLAIEAGLLDAADGISIHPYRQSYSPENIPENPSTFEGRPTDRYRTYEEQIETLRAMVGKKPIAVTEVGWSTAAKGPLVPLTRETITELTQAKFALRQQIQDLALGIRPATYFMLLDRVADRPFPAGHIENSFGIVHADLTPKPAYTALQTLYSQLDDACTRNQDVLVRFAAKGVKWYLFDDNSRGVPMRKLVYWLPEPARDDFPVTHTSVILGEVMIRGVPLSDAPRLLRLHQVEGRWGYPVLVDFIGQRMDDNVGWTIRRTRAKQPVGISQ
jgi:hypothetical protein